MTAHRWRNSAGHLIRVDGHHVRCEECPCDTCPEGSALYKIKYAELDTTCGTEAANRYRLNIACECKCLITGTVPDPLPEGKTAADYYASYPITGQTGEAPNITYWQKTIAGGPFVDDDPLGKTAKEKCDAYQVDGCCGSCGWYKIRKAYYDAACLGVNSGYNDAVECECRCLITGTVPSPIPEGKTAEDYAGSYPITVTGEYKKELFGPYSATCALTADQVCAAAKIEGYDYAWGLSWDYGQNLPQMWYSTYSIEYCSRDCTGKIHFASWQEWGRTSVGFLALLNGMPGYQGCYDDGYHGYSSAVRTMGPEFRVCDINTSADRIDVIYNSCP